MLNSRVTITIPDIDRYVTDDYTIVIALQENINRISIGLCITNTKIGVSGYEEYWHFDKNEQKLAQSTFKTIEKEMNTAADDLTQNQLPHTLIHTVVRNKLAKIDPGHKERSGVYHYNWYTANVEKEGDWRKSLYGTRYPEHEMDIINLNWTQMEDNKTIEAVGTSRRDTIHKYKYANVSKQALQKIASIQLPGENVNIRLRDKDEIKLQDVDVQYNGEWEPLNSFITAGKNTLPWALLTGVLGLGIGHEMGNKPQTPMSTQSPSILQVQTPDPIKPPSTSPLKPQQLQKDTRGIRNNNPGNIERGKIKWNGMSTNQKDERFITFNRPEDGIRAMARTLRNYQSKHHLKTIEQILHRWAPQKENNTKAYIQSVIKHSGLPNNQPIDLNNDDILSKLISAMIQHENGDQPYNQDVILQAIQLEKTKNKSMPVQVDSPKRRLKHPPTSFIRPFDTKQVELFDKNAQKNATEQNNVKELLYRAIAVSGLKWPDIAKTLLKDLQVPKEMMPAINHEFLQIINTVDA